MASPRGKEEAARAAALGMLVRRLRRERDENLGDLAPRIPMSASNLSRLELGKQGPPSDEIIERVASALEAEPRELLRAAGRVSGGASLDLIEEHLTSLEAAFANRLDSLARDLREVKTALLSKQPSS